MLLAIGDPMAMSGSETDKTERFKKLMKAANTRMLIIDEVQHFVDQGSKRVVHHAADWMKTLVDEASVSLVVAGLPRSRELTMQNEQLDGRFMNPVQLPRFNWENQKHRDEFVGILAAFQKEISKEFELPDISNEEYAFRFYAASGGLIGLLTKFLRQAISNAVYDETRVIGKRQLELAFQEASQQHKRSSNDPDPFSKSFVINKEVRRAKHYSKLGMPSSVLTGSDKKKLTSSELGL